MDFVFSCVLTNRQKDSYFISIDLMFNIKFKCLIFLISDALEKYSNWHNKYGLGEINTNRVERNVVNQAIFQPHRYTDAFTSKYIVF